MSNLSIMGEVRDGVNIFFSTVKDVLGIDATTRDFNDINKAARENELTLYTIASENVPVNIYNKMSEAISHQILASIRQILSATAVSHPEEVMRFIKGNFTNNSDIVNKLKGAMHDVSDSLGENVELSVELKDIKINFNESDTSRHHATGNKVYNTYASRLAVGQDTFNQKGIATLQLANDGGKNNHSESDNLAIKIPSKLHTISVNYTTANNEILQFTLTLAISVKIMAVDSVKLIEAMVSAKERSVFYSYIKYRATGKSFFNDFIFNINEIKKQVKRDTSKDLSERILGNLLTKSGFTRPKVLAEMTELKNFVVIISMDEVNRLKLDHRIDLTRGSGLKTIFNNMNILSLIIYDEAKEKLIMYQSDRPTEMVVLSISDLNNDARISKIFSTLG